MHNREFLYQHRYTKSLYNSNSNVFDMWLGVYRLLRGEDHQQLGLAELWSCLCSTQIVTLQP